MSNHQNKEQMNFETLQIIAGYEPNESLGSRAVPIHQTTSFQFLNSTYAKALFALEKTGNIYTRIGNPTNTILENRITQLEKGTASLAVSSGHAAQLIAMLTIAKNGDNIVSSPFLYGGTYNQFNVLLRNMGIDVRFAESLEPLSIEKHIDKNTKAIYVETIGNPSFRIPDFEAISALTNTNNIPLIVDNTFGAGGYFCQPIKFGAGIVTHSATKWIGGHGTTMGGLIVDSGKFNWENGQFPLLTEPSKGYHGIRFSQKFKEQGFIARARAEILRDTGAVQSPLNSFQLLQGLETLSLRAAQQAKNALTLAQWLEKHPKVKSVNYPGLPNHSEHHLAKKYLSNGFGSVLSFETKGNIQASSKFIDKLNIAGHMANVGDNRTLAIQPAITTHQQLTNEEQAAAGITPQQLRISLGIEHIQDIIDDFDQALNSI